MRRWNFQHFKMCLLGMMWMFQNFRSLCNIILTVQYLDLQRRFKSQTLTVLIMMRTFGVYLYRGCFYNNWTWNPKWTRGKQKLFTNHLQKQLGVTLLFKVKTTVADSLGTFRLSKEGSYIFFDGFFCQAYKQFDGEDGCLKPGRFWRMSVWNGSK